MKKFILFGGLLFAAVVGAADSIPFTFTPGSPIKSAEVNENFKSLQTRAVAHESRLQGLEAALSAKPTDQLVCVLYPFWAVDGTSFPCIQASNPTTQQSLSMPQILAQGWISVSSGGADVRMVMTFRK
jgi:hypothetical protein